MTHPLLFLLLLGTRGPAASAGAPSGQEPVVPGLAKPDPYTPLEVGQSLEVTQPTMLHWKMLAGEAYVLTMTSREYRRDYAYVYLAASRPASEEDYDTEWIVNGTWSWTLDAFSRPRLSAGGSCHSCLRAKKNYRLLALPHRCLLGVAHLRHTEKARPIHRAREPASGPSAWRDAYSLPLRKIFSRGSL